MIKFDEVCADTHRINLEIVQFFKPVKERIIHL